MKKLIQELLLAFPDWHVACFELTNGLMLRTWR
jgi:hypothetical protein